MDDILKVRIRSLRNTISYLEEEIVDTVHTSIDMIAIQSTIDILNNKLERLKKENI